MTTLRKQVLIGLTAISLGVGSLAAYASSAPKAEGARHEQMKERFEKKREKRNAELREKLNLSATQEGAWQTYLGAQVPPKPMARSGSREDFAKLTAPERLERQHQMVQRAEQQLAKRVTATKDFYAALTPEQRETFDKNFSHKRGPRHDRGMHKHPRG